MVDRPVRFVTAASLFDGHDAAINIIRRLLQQSGAEVIHLGHNRSVDEIVQTAIQEDADGIAVSSYQGGHIEFFKYLIDRLKELGACHVRVFGGGGGVIVPHEIAELEAHGVSKIFSPDDGMRLGLQGMVDLMLEACRQNGRQKVETSDLYPDDVRSLARALTAIENGSPVFKSHGASKKAAVIGITGPGGAGKSTLTDELLRRLLNDIDDLRAAVLAVDPTRRRTGGALLGDRIRMNALFGAGADRVFMRSFATRRANRSISEALRQAVSATAKAGYGLILIETAGIGQSDTEVVDLADVSVYVMTPEYGAPTQLEKIDMLDHADFVVLNKFEKRGAEDALRDVRKQIQRNRGLWQARPEEMPVYPVMASHFGDSGVDRFYRALVDHLNVHFGFGRATKIEDLEIAVRDVVDRLTIIPPRRQGYLGEIVDTCRNYRKWCEQQIDLARRWGQARGVRKQLEDIEEGATDGLAERVDRLAQEAWSRLDDTARDILDSWEKMEAAYRGDELTYRVRDREVKAPLYTETLSGTRLPRVAFPRIEDPGERLRFGLLENVPGRFPYTAGLYPFKRTEEDPTRMFAGEGSPERTNRRFHLLAAGMPAVRLSTAFDSVTLYGRDPDEQPDVYGKVGNAGVSICTLDDMKKLYSGFDLCHPSTSVSMTINGPAPMILSMFMNTAIDQQVERYLRKEGKWEDIESRISSLPGRERAVYVPFGSSGRTDRLPENHDGIGLGLLGTSGRELVERGWLDRETYERLKADTLSTVRGTVQADILKEDQAQNTCIFSTEFALRMMGDVQHYFIDNRVRNYYSVSVSGYHIAEAGANPITQLAFTLANGFTYVEYYLSRGMKIDDFAPNLSFFFSNGMDAEYSVIGRVARRIWAVAMRDRYGASPRSQMLKYHIQTSGRSLHAREIQFNDIRTTLQALLAVYDNCNSLHTNAFDEAITTPTEESVRRAMAIQLIINREFGPAKCENINQGSYLLTELTDLVEEAVLRELEAINARGGVLGAMETMYQRGKIQEESAIYEHKKHTGELPIVGVNVFNAPDQPESALTQLMRSTDEEKRHQIENLIAFKKRNAEVSPRMLDQVWRAARNGGNVFEALMDAVTVCSLGQLTEALFEVGGEYRRSM